jgi:hypothetical protein
VVTQLLKDHLIPLQDRKQNQRQTGTIKAIRPGAIISRMEAFVEIGQRVFETYSASLFFHNLEFQWN